MSLAASKRGVSLLTLFAALLLVGPAIGQEKKGKEQPTLRETIVDIMEKAIPQDLLSPDGQWSIIDSREAIPHLFKKSQNTGHRIQVEMTVAEIEVFNFPISQTETIEVLKVSGTMRLLGTEQGTPIKFRGREFYLTIQPPAGFIIFPLSYQLELQEVRPHQKIILDTSIDFLSFGWFGSPLGPKTNILVIYANPGFPQGDLLKIVPK